MPAKKFRAKNDAKFSDAKLLPSVAPTEMLSTPNMAPFVRGAMCGVFSVFNVSWISVVLID